MDRAALGAGAAGRDVEALDQAADPEVAGLAGHEDDRVGPLVGQELRRHRGRDRVLVGATRALAATARHARALVVPRISDSFWASAVASACLTGIV